MRRISLIGLLSFLLSTSGMSQTSSQVNIPVHEENKTGIMVTSDEPQFVIKLKSNPTTGYSWFLREYPASLIQPVKHEFERSTDKKLIGAPTYEVWTFLAKPAAFKVPQQALMRFVYARPWEGSDQGKQLVFRISMVEKIQK